MTNDLMNAMWDQLEPKVLEDLEKMTEPSQLAPLIETMLIQHVAGKNAHLRNGARRVLRACLATLMGRFNDRLPRGGVTPEEATKTIKSLDEGMEDEDKAA